MLDTACATLKLPRGPQRRTLTYSFTYSNLYVFKPSSAPRWFTMGDVGLSGLP